MSVKIEFANGQWYIFYKIGSCMLNIAGTTCDVYEVIRNMKMISESSDEIYLLNTLQDILEIYM